MYTFNTRTATPLRIARVARVATAAHLRNKAKFVAQVQQLQAQYGVSSTQAATRTNVAQHPRSAVAGACKQVHAIAQQNGFNRAATLAACKAAGINPATAATQYAVAKRAQFS
jgi:hypothetical protein